MARIGNYGDLEAAISEWLGRQGDAAIGARADALIQLFEADFVLDPDMRTIDMEEVDTAVLSAAAIPLPAGFVEMITLKGVGTNSGQDQPLEYISPAGAVIMDANAQSSDSALSVAKNYTIKAGNIIVTPQLYAPIGGTLELAYYQLQPLSQASNGVNWLIQKFPNIYLYGALHQAALYVEDDAAVGKWGSKLAQAKVDLAASERKRKTSGGSLVMRPSSGFRR